jgi:hypothetical protein
MRVLVYVFLTLQFVVVSPSHGSLSASCLPARITPDQCDRESQWKDRRDILSRILEDEQWIANDEAVATFLEILATENALVSALYSHKVGAGERLGSAYVDYHSYQLMDAALRLIQERPSVRALSIAAQSAYSPDSVFAVKLAEQAVKLEHVVILDEFSYDVDYSRLLAANLAKLMFMQNAKRGKPLSLSGRQRLVSRLTALADDAEPVVAEEAVKALGESDDSSVLPVLEAVANAGRQPGMGPMRDERMRKAAEQAIQKLRRKR